MYVLEKRSTTVRIFAADLWEALDEVEGDVRPHLGGHLQGQRQANRVKMFGLVALECQAAADVLMYRHTCVRSVEVTTETMQGLLEALVAVLMWGDEDIGASPNFWLVYPNLFTQRNTNQHAEATKLRNKT